MRAIDAGAAPSRRAARRLLDADLGAAELARDLLRSWLEEEGDELEKVRMARLLLEAGGTSEAARTCLRDGLRSSDWRVASRVIMSFQVTKGLVDAFVEDVMTYVEEAPEVEPFLGPSSGLGVSALRTLLPGRRTPGGHHRSTGEAGS